MSGPWERYKGPQEGPWKRYADQGFELAVEGVLKSEGGYVHDPDDPGGETKYGISKRSYPDLDIPSLSVEDAKRIYKKDYWDKLGDVPSHLREAAFDGAVNQGVGFVKEALAQAGGDLRRFLDLRAQRYASIIQRNPEMAKFQRGWEKRLEQFQPQGPWAKYRGT